jgi:hypoxanthine phosphoribosyltransferase
METEPRKFAAGIGRVLITREEIDNRVRALARQISADYDGRNPILVSLLKGGFVFLADLTRQLTIPHEIDFIKVSSYRDGTSRSKKMEVFDDILSDVRGRDVILIEGIVDTGHTVSILERLLVDRRVASMKVCALLDKPSSREITVPVDYVGFTVPDCFVVGYGLDFNERFRSLSYIAELVPMQNLNESTAGFVVDADGGPDVSAEISRTLAPGASSGASRESSGDAPAGESDS